MGVHVRDVESGGALRRARRQRGQRDRRVGRPAAPAGAARRGRAAAHPPEPRHPRHDPPRGPAAGRRRDRARGQRPLDLRAAVARATRCWERPTTTTRGRSSTSSHRATTSTTCWRPSTTFFGTELGAEKLTGAFAGVRPLISTGDPKKSVDISRKAELYETSSGMITITGGKLTTWRRMAKMTVDRLVEREAREAPCRTHEIPLGQAMAVEELPRVEGVEEAAYGALAGRYGHSAHAVLALAAERGELAQPIVAGLPDMLAEVTLAARHEQARSIGDVLLRRTRLGLLAARELIEPATDGEPGPVGRVGDVLARELGWDSSRLAPRARALRRGGPRRGDRGGGRGRGGRRPAWRTGRIRRGRRVKAPLQRLRACATTLELGERPLLMGIVNASPDSFSDGGLHATLDAQLLLASRAAGCGRGHPRHRRRVGLDRPPAGRGAKRRSSASRR